MLKNPYFFSPCDYALSVGYCFSSGWLDDLDTCGQRNYAGTLASIAGAGSQSSDRGTSHQRARAENRDEFRSDASRQCDGGRIAQLLGNSISTARRRGPFRCRRERMTAHSNCPSPIRVNRFQPKRWTGCSSRSIACPRRRPLKGWDWDSTSPRKSRAHGGRIDVTSSPQETRFTFRMPLSDTAD
jgi:hypothetical protein